jgi:hypothetical protein
MIAARDFPALRTRRSSFSRTLGVIRITKGVIFVVRVDIRDPLGKKTARLGQDWRPVRCMMVTYDDGLRREEVTINNSVICMPLVL